MNNNREIWIHTHRGYNANSAKELNEGLLKVRVGDLNYSLKIKQFIQICNGYNVFKQNLY